MYFSKTCLKDECFELRAFRSSPSTKKIDGSSVKVFSEKRQLGLLIKSSQKTVRGSFRATAVFVAEIFHSALNGSHRSAYNGEATRAT